MEAYIVLGITIAAFIGLGVLLLVKGRALRWPKGNRRTVKTSKYKIHIIKKDNVSNDLMVKCERAFRATVSAWSIVFAKSEDSVTEKVREIAILFLTDDEWAKQHADSIYVRANGYQSYVTRMLGKGIPLLVIREIYQPNDTRDPLIAHELIHVLAGNFSPQDNHYHNSSLLWRPAPDSVEHVADNLYRQGN